MFDFLGGGGGPQLDIQMHRIPIIGSFFANPQEQHQQQQFQNAALAYGAYRPEMAQAQMNSLRNRSSIYQNANNLLSTMTGGMGGVDMSQAYQTPMGPTMMTHGQQVQGRGGGGGGGLLGGLLGGGLLGTGGAGGTGLGLLGGGGGLLGGLGGK